MVLWANPRRRGCSNSDWIARCGDWWCAARAAAWGRWWGSGWAAMGWSMLCWAGWTGGGEMVIWKHPSGRPAQGRMLDTILTQRGPEPSRSTFVRYFMRWRTLMILHSGKTNDENRRITLRTGSGVTRPLCRASVSNASHILRIPHVANSACRKRSYSVTTPKANVSVMRFGYGFKYPSVAL